MLRAFERCIGSGQLACWAAEQNGHEQDFAAQKLRSSDGSVMYMRRLDGTVPQVPALAADQKLHRTWTCRHPSPFLGLLGLDTWTHHEVVLKDSETSLQVTDRLVWRCGSSVQRRYRVRILESGGLQREAGDWQVRMTGISWPARSRVEAHMLATLPAASDQVWERFVCSRALPPTST